MNNSPLQILKDNLWWNNPVFIQVLGICSALAVTNNMVNTLTMGIGVIFVASFTNITVSIFKEMIPRKVRMIIQTLIISFYVIIVDIILKAYFPLISKELGPYVGLIITNCIIMGRAEAFAQANRPLISFRDGFSSGVGYLFVLITIALVRELLGSGSIFGIIIIPVSVPRWTIMIMAPSAFFVLAVFIWAGKSIQLKKNEESK